MFLDSLAITGKRRIMVSAIAIKELTRDTPINKYAITNTVMANTILTP
jgi:hypothetical protein